MPSGRLFPVLLIASHIFYLYSIKDCIFIPALTYFFFLSALCGGNITSMNGTIYSPGHPAEYPHFQDCMWTVRVPPGYGIYINFSVINTEPIYDYITVW